MKITIGGDFYIDSSSFEDNLFSQEIIEYFNLSDFSVVNLEGPVTDSIKENRIIKTGPHLRMDYDIYRFIKLLQIDAVTLANNHIFDYGRMGLSDTINYCNQNQIRYVGGGLSEEELSKPLVINEKGIKISIVNFCENEWSTNKKSEEGANPMDLIENTKQIKKAKEVSDFVIVIVHGGHEHYDLPSPRMVKQYRFYAENGADAVICHHSHCISGFEYHKGVPIIYSLGNMIFTKKSDRKTWYQGQLVQLEVVKEQPVKIEMKGIKQNSENYRLTFLDDEENNLYQQKLLNLNEIIGSEKHLEEHWKNFIEENIRVANILSPTNVIPGRYLKGFLNHTGINKVLMREEYIKSILNHIRCEAHRDMILELLQLQLYKK